MAWMLKPAEVFHTTSDNLHLNLLSTAGSVSELKTHDIAREGDLQVSDRCSWAIQLSWLTDLDSHSRTFFRGR